MRIILIAIYLNLNFWGQSQTNEKLLFKSYKKKSVELLNVFFSNWENEIQPINKNELELLNDTIKTTYKIYQEFMNWKNINNSNYKYVFIQNEIKIYFSDKVYFSMEEIDSLIKDKINSDNTLSQTLKEQYSKKNNDEFSSFVRELYYPDFNQISNTKFYKTEFNFRPEIKSTNKILYLNKKYSDIIKKFLTSEPTENKKLFLDQYFVIFKEFMGYWEFKPYSFCSISFDKKMEYVKIRYGVGEIVYMKYENEVWKFILHELEFNR